MLMLILSILACKTTGDFAITKTEFDEARSNCTFTVEFPADYVGPEKGTQEFRVEPFQEERLTMLDKGRKTLQGGTEGIGADLRRRCAGYLLEPEVKPSR